MEVAVAEEHYGSLEFNERLNKEPDFLQESNSLIRKKLVILFEKFLRAIARLLACGTFSQEAQVMTGFMSDFLLLDDENLGNKNYNKVKE